jgi:hypothetical protein
LQEAANSASEAQGYHEDRAWDERNNALEEMSDSFERLDDALSTLENFTPPDIAAIDDEVNAVREKVDEAKAEMEHLL